MKIHKDGNGIKCLWKFENGVFLMPDVSVSTIIKDIKKPFSSFLGSWQMTNPKEWFKLSDYFQLIDKNEELEREVEQAKKELYEKLSIKDNANIFTWWNKDASEKWIDEYKKKSMHLSDIKSKYLKMINIEEQIVTSPQFSKYTYSPIPIFEVWIRNTTFVGHARAESTLAVEDGETEKEILFSKVGMSEIFDSFLNGVIKKDGNKLVAYLKPKNTSSGLRWSFASYEEVI